MEKRAAGGPVGKGSPYLVGEEGPELFVPSIAGDIVPLNKLTGTTGAALRQSERIEKAVKEIIAQVGATGPGDMGKVMGVASKSLSGKADGKAISEMVKACLAS
jgi:Glu-tRNA(Gln) amidotransferase subunit E-like FAD-binding protein